MMLRTLGLALLLCPAALAAPHGADESSGKLEFVATQADARFTGAFKRFRVMLDFDPAMPAQGRLDVTVEAASIDTKDGERDEVLRGPDFFAAERYAQAEYHATRFERAGSGWRADGELSIRGVRKAVPVTFTLAAAGGKTIMKGGAALKRLDFGLGQGEWASTEWVGDAVDVRFELTLSPIG
jgi:polyisoprenoid-binding protein YceI